MEETSHRVQLDMKSFLSSWFGSSISHSVDVKRTEADSRSPSGHHKAQLAHAVQQSGGLLEESGHLWVLVYGTLDGQEAAVQLVDETNVHYIAEGPKTSG